MIRYALIASMVINGILIAAVVGIMPFVLYLSALIHCAAFWYLRILLNEMNQYNKDIVSLLETCQSLQDHIESVHEMEMFYGEPVLQEMIDHTRQVNDEIEYYIQKYLSEEEEGEMTVDNEEDQSPREIAI